MVNIYNNVNIEAISQTSTINLQYYQSLMFVVKEIFNYKLQLFILRALCVPYLRLQKQLYDEYLL